MAENEVKREPFIRFSDVKKIYKMGETEIHALAGVDFEIEKGEVVIIAGASGAGKSTILNILGGMDTLSSGEIVVDGEHISDYSQRKLIDYRRHDVGFVFQFYNLVQNLTAKENVELATQISPDSLNIEEVLRDVGLENRMDHFPAQLSGGEQQRVALARALVNKPEILLCDEPTGNLDPKNSWEIMQMLEEFNAEGTTVVVVTHNREIVDAMQKRVITMNKGFVESDEEIGGYIYED